LNSFVSSYDPNRWLWMKYLDLLTTGSLSSKLRLSSKTLPSWGATIIRLMQLTHFLAMDTTKI
jgi:hypothetical protein